MRGFGGMWFLVKRGNTIVACVWAKRVATAREKLGNINQDGLTFRPLNRVLEWSS